MTNLTARPAFLDQLSFDYHTFSNNLSLIEQTFQDDDIFLPMCGLYCTAFVCGIVGNFLVILSHAANSKRRNTTSVFLVGLAVSDILFLVVCAPHDLITKMAKDIWGGRWFCKMGWFIEMVTTSGSVLTLVAVSVERYVVIVHPMRSRTWCSAGRTSKMLAALWSLAMLISTPLLYLQDTRRKIFYNNDDYVLIVLCSDVNGSPDFRKGFTWFQVVSIFVVPAAAMIFFYSVVIRVLWRSTKQLNHLTENRDSDRSDGNQVVMTSAYSEEITSCGESCPRRSNESLPMKMRRMTTKMMMCRGNASVETAKGYGNLKESRKQVIKMLMIIILAFFLLVGPKWCMTLMRRYNIADRSHEYTFIFGMAINFLPFLHTCVNPVIYGFLSSSFKIGLRIAFSHVGAKIRSCCSCLYYHFCCCYHSSNVDDDGGGSRCGRYYRNERNHRNTKLSESRNETISHHTSNQDDSTTAATTLATKSPAIVTQIVPLLQDRLDQGKEGDPNYRQSEAFHAVQ